MKILLPKPVSVNSLYRVTCRNGYPSTYISQKGKDWFDEAGWIVRQQFKIDTLNNDVIVYMWVYTTKASDLDNFSKITLDLLQKSQIIKNDKQVVELHMYKERVKHKKEERMELQIEEWE